MSVEIRSRKDGILELAPKHGHADGFVRFNVIVTVLLVSAGLWLCGLMPPGVLGILAAACVSGEIVLAVHAAALALRHPPARVYTLAGRRTS